MKRTVLERGRTSVWPSTATPTGCSWSTSTPGGQRLAGHRPGGQGDARAVSGSNHPVQPDLLVGGPRGDPGARRDAVPVGALVHQAGHGGEPVRCSAASTPGTTTSATTTTPTPGLVASMVVMDQMSKAGQPPCPSSWPTAASVPRLRRDQPGGRGQGRHPAGRQAAYADGRTDRLDGLTVEYDDWWFNVRPRTPSPSSG